VGARADNLDERQSRGFHNLARLRPGVRVEQAQAAVAALDAQLAAAFPRSNREVHHRVVPYSGVPYGAQKVLGPALRMLLPVALTVLLIVSANVASLLLARASSREKEIAIRLAVGAGRGRVIRQLLTESLVLSALGGVGGVMLASWGVSLLGSFLPATNLPVTLAELSLDGRTLLLTALLALATGVGFGLLPAWRGSRLKFGEVLKQGGRSVGGGAGHHRLRQAFVVAQVALSLVLLMCAGLCLKGLQRARQVPLGFEPEGVLIARMQIGMNGYTEQTGRGFYRRLLQRLAATPGVEEATLASWLPLGFEGCKGHGVDVEGYQRPAGENPTYEYAVVAPRYFAALRIRLVAGREFAERDDAEAMPVAIVNEAFAGRFWPGQNPLGRRFRAAGKDWTVVGVAEAGKYNRIEEEPWPFFYLPYLQYVPDLDLGLVVRTQGDPVKLARTVSGVVRDLDGSVALQGTMRMKDHVAAALFVQRTASSLLTALSLVSLTLAALGVYAVMAYAVSQRRQEFGIRMALGARAGDVVLQVARMGLGLTGLGVALGLGLGAAVTRLLTGFLYGVSPYDPWTLGGVPLLLGAVAMLACWLPARRAARVDPMVALRSE
jgi:predicted permease